MDTFDDLAELTGTHVTPSNPVQQVLQRTLSVTGVGLWFYDFSTEKVALDETCLRLFDMDADGPLTIGEMRSRIHPDDVDGYREAVLEFLSTGVDFDTEYRVIHRDGSVHFIEGRGWLNETEGPDGPSKIVHGICIDISGTRQLQGALRRTENRMQHIADSVPGWLSCCDRNMVINYVSSAYTEQFGVRSENLLGQHVRDVIGEALWQERRHLYARVLTGETVRDEQYREMPDGSRCWMAVTYRPDRDEHGNVQGIIALALDINAQKRVEAELVARTRELERSNQELEQFAYVASHDLKAPLRAMDALVVWLNEDLADLENPEVRENLGLLRTRTARMNRLLDELLEYSRAGRRVGETSEVDTQAMVRDIATMLGPPESMRIEADGSLPTLTTHGIPLEQVLRNLVHNALKHHPREEGLIRVCAWERDDDWVFSVQDDGAGIPPRAAERVFKMFQTLRPSSEQDGAGMGLAIVRRIVEWRGGRVWFQDGPGGRGTDFRFTWTKTPVKLNHREQGAANDERPLQTGSSAVG